MSLDGDSPQTTAGTHIPIQTIDQNNIDTMANPENTLTVAMRNPQSLNPLLNTDPTVDQVLRLIYQPLFEMEAMTPVPVLASALHIAQNYTQAVVVLSDHRWADGMPVVAQDVVFTLNTIRNNNHSIYYPMIENIIGFVALDDRSVQITFYGDVGGRMKYSLLFPIIPAHFFLGQLSSRNMQALGSGPFMIANTTFPREMLLMRNPHNLVVPNIYTIRVIITRDRNTDFHALNQGIINVVRGEMADFGYFGISPLHITAVPYATTNLDFLAFNFDNIILANVHVRQAIAYLLLDHDMIYLTYFGQAQKTSSVVHPQSHLYLNYLNYRQIDHDRAWELFTTAGFGDIGDNVLGSVVAGVPVPLPTLRILVNTESHERHSVANLLAQNLESFGITVDLMALDFDQYMQEINNRNFDMLFAGVELERDLHFLLHTNGANNLMNYTSATLDSYLEQAQYAFSTEMYEQAWHNIQTYINENLPLISIVFRNGILFTKDSLFVPYPPSIDNMYRGVQDWVVE